MVRLVPMTAAEYDIFLEHEIQEYARERTEAGYWTEAEALEESRKAHHALLPEGLKTSNQCIYTVQETERGEAVGVIWLQATLNSPRPSGFILDLEIDEPFRRKGYARQAMLQLEAVANGMGCSSLACMCLPTIRRPCAIRRILGYTVASLNMLKPLTNNPPR